MSGLTMCPACGAAVPTGGFCAICGAALGPVVPQAPVEPTTQPNPYAVPAHRVQRVRAAPAPRLTTRRGGALAVVAVLVAAGFLVFGTRGGHTVTGQLTLTGGTDAVSAGSTCSGTGGYDDISLGAEVRVEDESGTLLATGQLESGTYDGLSCRFPFTVHDVPRARFYEISAGRASRGGANFSTDQLTADHWSAHLTLGS